MTIDYPWFRDRQRQKGVTSEDIAQAAGRDRTAVSKILNGKQRMTMEWARAFAKVLEAPLAEILERAGYAEEQELPRPLAGMSESDATPFHIQDGRQDTATLAARAFGGDKPGVDVWRVGSKSLEMMGYFLDDFILVDTLRADMVRPGDVVIAQVYDRGGSAKTVLRRFEPPVLVAASMDPEDWRVHVVDGNNVLIRGKVVASWRINS
jgi:transcriptional regulator with XRE-family HTH domain